MHPVMCHLEGCQLSYLKKKGDASMHHSTIMQLQLGCIHVVVVVLLTPCAEIYHSSITLVSILTCCIVRVNH